MMSRRQLWALLALTLMWGVNWPMMKLSLQQLTPLYFRASTMLLGAAWLFVYVAAKGQRMHPTGREWLTILWLGLPNVLGWHTLSIFGVQELASGRAAILGFTMPIFTVLLGPPSSANASRHAFGWRSSAPRWPLLCCSGTNCRNSRAVRPASPGCSALPSAGPWAP